MKRLPMIGAFVLLFGGFFVPSLAAQDNLEGDWVGGSNLFENPVFVHVRFTPTSSGFGGITNIQLWKVSNRPLSVVKAETSQVHFEFPSTTGIPFVADRKLKDGVIQGTMRAPDVVLRVSACGAAAGEFRGSLRRRATQER